MDSSRYLTIPLLNCVSPKLHLFQSEDSVPTGHHFGLDVEDFESVYLKAQEMGAQIGEGYFSELYELPDGAVQLYLRDPAGNMVEVNYPRAADLDASVVGHPKRLPKKEGQSAPARLYLR